MSWDNSTRIKKFIERSQQSETTRVVYLGASITCGVFVKPEEAYTSIVSKYLQENYTDRENISFYIEAEPGISSQMAMIRSKEMLFVHEPDLVILEFSVNDKRDEVHRVVFESLMRKIIKYKTEPALIVVGLRNENNYHCNGQMRALCSHYHIPFVDVGSAVTDKLEAKELTWDQYALDYIHPNAWGHQLIANKIIEVFSDQKPEEVTSLAAPLFGDRFENLKPLTNSYYVWRSGDKTIKKTTLTSKIIYLVNIEKNDEASSSVEIYLDDKFLVQIDSYNSTGWDNPVVHLLVDEPEKSTHSIEIRPTNGGTGFTMLCLAYC